MRFSFSSRERRKIYAVVASLILFCSALFLCCYLRSWYWKVCGLPSLATALCPRTVPVTLWVWEGKQNLSFLTAASESEEETTSAGKSSTAAATPIGRPISEGALCAGAPRSVLASRSTDGRGSMPSSVAYYAGTLYLVSGYVFFKPRMSRLEGSKGLSMCPVFRIENKESEHAPSPDSADRIAEIIQKYLARHPARCVQVDYDATPCERDFYARVLRRLRPALPKGTHIAVTALASWCLDDRWLRNLPADEAIVMLFSMGRGRNETLRLLEKRRLNTGANMEMSIGISANEALTNKRLRELGVLGAARRLYVFNSLSWTGSRFHNFSEEVLYSEEKHSSSFDWCPDATYVRSPGTECSGVCTSLSLGHHY